MGFLHKCSVSVFSLFGRILVLLNTHDLLMSQRISLFHLNFKTIEYFSCYLSDFVMIKMPFIFQFDLFCNSWTSYLTLINPRIGFSLINEDLNPSNLDDFEAEG